MIQFLRSFRWVIVGGLVLSRIAMWIANSFDDERSANYVAIVAVLVNLFGFLLLSAQLGATKEATENQTRWEIEQVSFNVYKMLVDQPSLRPYFYEGKSLPVRAANDAEAEPAAELRWKLESACDCCSTTSRRSSARARCSTTRAKWCGASTW